MIKAKITKIDGNTVDLLTEHGDDLQVNRSDIDFGILEGDSLFLRTESGEYKFRRLEKDEALEGEAHYYDTDWKKREDEYKAVLDVKANKYNQDTEQEKEKSIMINMSLWFIAIVIIVLLVIALKDKIGVIFIVS